jgi:hypothetical protein
MIPRNWKECRRQPFHFLQLQNMCITAFRKGPPSVSPRSALTRRQLDFID